MSSIECPECSETAEEDAKVLQRDAEGTVRSSVTVYVCENGHETRQ